MKGKRRAGEVGLRRPPDGKRLTGNYDFGCSAGILEPSVAQPPLPLQEFLPLQPLSLDLQPPLPLQEFWPLQACFSFTFLSDFLSALSSWAVIADLTPGNRLDALMLALVPASKPATAAPVMRNLLDLVICCTTPIDLKFNCIPQAELTAMKICEPSASEQTSAEICGATLSGARLGRRRYECETVGYVTLIRATLPLKT